MEKSEFVKQLIKSAFIETIKRKDIKSLVAYNNNPRVLLRDLMIAIGAENDLLEKPAHFEQLEEVLKRIINELALVLENQREEFGYSVKFNPNHELIVKTESFATQKDFRLSISESEYFFEEQYKSSGAFNAEQIKVSGNSSKNEIIYLKVSDSFNCTKEVIKKMVLDDFGFVKEEFKAEKEISRPKRFGNLSEATATTIKRKSHISRNEDKIKNGDNSIIKWNGNPLHLNEVEENENSNNKRIMQTVIKCPNSQKYYEDVFGIHIVLKEIKQE